MSTDDVIIRRAELDDCLAIAELAQLAGEGIPGVLWADSQRPGETLEQAGARSAAIEDNHFSYRNAWLAGIDDTTAGMLLGYRLPAAADNRERPQDFPDFIRPMIELEQCVPESYYVNMLATYPRYQGRGVGTRLMHETDRLARAAGATTISILVFGHNTGALRLYRRLGFDLVTRRPMAASPTTPAGEILLLTRPTRPA